MKVNIPVTLGTIFLFTGLALLTGWLYSFFSTREFLQNAIVVESRVVETYYESGIHGPGSLYTVFFYVVDGKEYITTGRGCSGSCVRYKDDSIVEILVSPKDPQDIREDTFSDLWGGSIILIIVGLPFCFVGSLILRLRYRNSFAVLKANIPATVGTIFLLAGLATLTGGLYSFFSTREFLQNAIVVESRVVETYYESSNKGRGSLYTVFSYVVDGKEYITTGRGCSGSCSQYYDDSIVEILVSPKDPQDIREDTSSGWFVSIILIIIGLPFCFFGSLILRYRNSFKENDDGSFSADLD